MPQLAAVEGAVKTGATLWDFSVSHVALVTPSWPRAAAVSVLWLKLRDSVSPTTIPPELSFPGSTADREKTGVIEIVRKGTEGVS